MTGARLYVRRPSGAVAVFIATDCTVADGTVTARGHWKDLPAKPPAEYVWPLKRVLELRREAAS